MKIIFLCGSLESGRDGVGDYTRRLACELIKRGYKVEALALNDNYLVEEILDSERVEDIDLKVLRIPSNWSQLKRFKRAKVLIETFNPDWISLQFVPYSFHPKGLPFGLTRHLENLGKGRKWHIMFHEIWVGEEKGESLKNIYFGLIQRSIILRMIHKLRFEQIHTSIPAYKEILRHYKTNCSLLPLFSNIPKINVNINGYAYRIAEYISGKRSGYLIGTLFGSIYFESWDLHSLLQKLSARSNNKKIVIASIGKMSSGKKHWKKMQSVYPLITFLTLGEHEPSFISYWLSAFTDFGILTTPPELAGKSGSFMAFKEHGVPVLCNEPSILLKFPYTNKMDASLTVVSSKTENINIPGRLEPFSFLDNTVSQFIQSLN